MIFLRRLNFFYVFANFTIDWSQELFFTFSNFFIFAFFPLATRFFTLFLRMLQCTINCFQKISLWFFFSNEFLDTCLPSFLLHCAFPIQLVCAQLLLSLATWHSSNIAFNTFLRLLKTHVVSLSLFFFCAASIC